ncbi:MAG: polysaccharide biosynthesis protein [Bacteroidia bacterium]|nr:polysaccharide biosynthesis protein [Bacteroidia bacterium]MCZ2249659.1 polysaccharide biosynthesis protein [Bacteroidia bacterium]
MIIPKKNTPRWIVFVLDITICFFSIFLSYLLRFNFNIPAVDLADMPIVISVIIAVRSISFFIGKTYSGIIRYTSLKDAQKIFTVITLGSLVFVFIDVISYLTKAKFIIPTSIIILDFITSIFFLIASRTLVKVLYYELKNPSRAKTKVIVYGAGEAGVITLRTLDKDAGTKYKVVAFIDDNRKKKGKKIEGVKIYHTDELDSLLENMDITFIIISSVHIPASKKQILVEKCLKYNTRVLNVPPIANWINGQLSFKQIKKIRIEELLERDEIVLDKEKILTQLKNKIVLVTGAAGSIGSELVRQIINFSPQKIILLDQAESAIYDLVNELNEFKKTSFEEVIADITNLTRMENVFQHFKPQIVYHAAAYKHVPLMEMNPSEAIYTNVGGTKIVADLAVKHKVEKFVLVSTDKAVNPTSVMGASKRAAEIYTQALSQTGSTKFIITRFGNVLGSNGSVIPLFKRQIEYGGPITITHPDITRYFMTIPEACQLVLEAGCMGNGGEIYIFDMGESVKIKDLAIKMVRLSGLTLGKDIEIVYTGLRPGEKLYEELLNNSENTLPTHNKQIMIAKINAQNYEKVNPEIIKLINLYQNQDNMKIVQQLKAIVSEYVSNNSIYESLDHKSK